MAKARGLSGLDGECVNPVVTPSLTCAAEHGLDVENGIDNGLHSRFSL